MDLTVRERRQKVADCIQAHVKQPLATIASATGLSKSSVYRHRQAIERCNPYPESRWWESQIGAAWLVRLVLAVVYHFGIKHSVGAESLSAFFHAIHVETHVGSSPTALRQLKHRVSQRLMAYEAAHAEQCQPATNPGICVGADETFFGLPILVLVELASGYIFTDVECSDRTYRTWLEPLQQWWDQSPWPCHFWVSDGAKALSKLAVSGLGCASVADLFHAMGSLGRPMGCALGRQLPS